MSVHKNPGNLSNIIYVFRNNFKLYKNILIKLYLNKKMLKNYGYLINVCFPGKFYRCYISYSCVG